MGLRAVVLWIACGCAAGGAAAEAGEIDVPSLDEPYEIEGQWRVHLGDAPDRAAYAAPEYDDGAWETMPVPGALGQNGHRDYVGVYWLRVTLRLPPSTRELSLRLAPIDTAGQVFLDGALAGNIGRVDPPIDDAHDLMSIWPVPVATIGDGEVVVALRCVRTADRADVTPDRGGIVGGPIWIGTTSDIVRAQIFRDTDKLISGIVVLVVALYHLYLFRRRREESHYFWFGAFAFFMGAYLLLTTELSIGHFGSWPNARVFWLVLMCTFPTFLQFLWPLLGRRIPWWWRANQIATVAVGVLFCAWPNGWLANKLIGWVELLLIPPLVLRVVSGVAASAWRGNQEAKTLALGTLALALAALNNILMERTTLPLPQVTSYAMALFVFSIAASLANRFARLYRELDEKSRLQGEVRLLNSQIQATVRTRSETLSTALTLLAQAPRKSDVEGLSSGSTIDGRYRIERVLGAGGMGTVYAAHDLATGSKVAVKVVKASSGGELEALHRFLREARAVAAVEHPAIVKMLHVDLSGDGLFYQAQELVEGATLEERLKAGAIEAALVARIGAILADALAAAHDKGVIHRDVKPSNIMLTPAAPGVKLLDFGVAKIVSSDAEHTGTGRYIGTPAYMAPELRFLADADVTDKIDVFALGVVLFRMLHGALPGRALDAPSHGELGLVIERCRAEDPAARPSARDLANELARRAAALGAPDSLLWDEETKTSGITDLLRDLVRF